VIIHSGIAIGRPPGSLKRPCPGVPSVGYTTAANAYVADIAPPRRRAEAMGLFSAAMAVGLIIAPVVGFMIVGAAGFSHLFYFSAGLAFMAFLVSLFARERRQPRKIK
jgi:DHA1 family tetracycline resistance protein-like MFS transporter